MKRSRGRGRRPQVNNNRSMDSAGPDVKIRGTAAHVYEKYLQLARDANSAGDRIMAESYLQHAEHYYRIVMASQPPPGAPGGPGGTAVAGGPNGGGEPRPNGGDSAPYAASGNIAAPNPPSFALADEAEDEEVS